MTKRFLIRAQKLFLTYSRCPEEWNVDFVKKRLCEEILIYKKGEKKYKSKVKAYVIAEEKHEEEIGEGEYERGKHYHCLVELNEKTDIRDEKYLDIEGNHGNYQAVKDVYAVINYVKKHGKWIGEGFPGMESKERNILEAKTEEDAKLMLMNRMGPMQQMEVRRQMKMKEKDKETTDTIVVKAPMYAFQKLLMPFFEGAGFFREGRPKGILAFGESESGKTTLAYRVAKELDQRVITVRNLRGLNKKYKGEEIILLDEMTEEKFKEWRETIIGMVTDPNCETEPYMGVQTLVWPRKVIVATNEDIKGWKKEIWTEAIASRFIAIQTYRNGEYKCYKIEKGKIEEINEHEVIKMVAGKEEAFFEEADKSFS